MPRREKKQEGGLRLDRKSGWVRGGEQGPAIVAGKPEESLLVKAVRYATDELQMPPAGKLPDREITALIDWVRKGAFDPRDGEPAKPGAMTLGDARNFWSFQPLKRLAVPDRARQRERQPETRQTRSTPSFSLGSTRPN